MDIMQIRNATQLIAYAGKRFLVDPMLAAKDAYPGFAGSARAHLRNPMVELPVPIERLLVDAIIVTHTHPDHWDDAAAALIPKSMLIYVQNASDEAMLRAQGFTQLRQLSDTSRYGDIMLTKTHGQHGSDAAYAIPELAQRLEKPAVWYSSILMKKRSICSEIQSGPKVSKRTCASISPMCLS